MAIFIDGPQQSGKTTLINLIKSNGNYGVYKFEFGKYSKEFNLHTKQELASFSLGKDLAMVQILPNLVDGNLLVDRGPLSTAYYSIVENRLPINLILKFLRIVKEYSSDHGFIFIRPKNRPKLAARNKDDGFDKGFEEDEDHFIQLVNLIKEAGLGDRVLFFENDFNYSPEENASRLAVEILRKRMDWE